MDDKPQIWVCSKWNKEPKDEEKWQLENCCHNDIEGLSDWCVRSRKEDTSHFLPKSDYVPCEAPIQWERVDITVQEPKYFGTCAEQNFFLIEDKNYLGRVYFNSAGYRVRSLVVERRKG